MHDEMKSQNFVFLVLFGVIICLGVTAVITNI